MTDHITAPGDMVAGAHLFLLPARNRGIIRGNRIERNAPAQRKLPGAWVTSWRLATMNNSSLPHSQNQLIDDPQPEFDLPRGQRVIRVEDVDNVNILFDPPIPCVMRDPEGQDRPVRIVDTDDLIARIVAGWQMVEVA